MTDSALDEVEGAENADEVAPMPLCVDVMAASGGDAPGAASMGDSVVEALGWGVTPVPP